MELPTDPYVPTSMSVIGKDPATGGEKELKLAAFAFMPPSALEEVAKVYGHGAKKYAPRNMEKGYPWSWSFSALMRHLWAYWRGEDMDPESGLPHLAHAAWHCLTLMDFSLHQRGTDDRSKS